MRGCLDYNRVTNENIIRKIFLTYFTECLSDIIYYSYYNSNNIKNTISKLFNYE